MVFTGRVSVHIHAVVNNIYLLGRQLLGRDGDSLCFFRVSENTAGEEIKKAKETNEEFRIPIPCVQAASYDVRTGPCSRRNSENGGGHHPGMNDVDSMMLNIAAEAPHLPQSTHRSNAIKREYSCSRVSAYTAKAFTTGKTAQMNIEVGRRQTKDRGFNLTLGAGVRLEIID